MPYTNPSAIQAIYNTDTTVILKGCAVVPGSALTQRALNATHTVLEDDWFVGVTDMDIAPSTLGNMYQNPFSNVQVRLASDVSKGDKLNVANALGEFQKAKTGALNVAYVAITAGTAGSNTTWAAPIGTQKL